jgi:magnesium-transporting ATPase (P-type)
MIPLFTPASQGILHIFHFNSTIKRMGVIVQDLTSPDEQKFWFACKGAPEVIYNLCRPSSLPDSLADV